jgi:primosomal protein N' (replication factor Y)
LARLVFRGTQEGSTETVADAVADAVREAIGGASGVARVLGPVPAPIGKIRGKFRYHFLVQCDDLQLLREALSGAQNKVKTASAVQWIVDIDPISML